MDDQDLIARIHGLVDEEHRLEQHATGHGLTSEDASRLRDLEVQLDQCWDLLRQRRARRDAGLDPVRRLVGSYITSLEMAGASLTLLALDDELTALWDAPVHTPALRWSE